MRRLKLVLSCYACEPNRGSEPGVGWAWALGMAKRHDTYVLTRANNSSVIQAELERLKLPEAETPKFIYIDLSPSVCMLKKKGILPVGLYYLLWQFKARKKLDSLNINADIIHHVTFNSFVCPGVWYRRKEKVVLGPLGGMSVCPWEYLGVYRGWSRSREFMRGLSRRLWWVNVFYLFARRNADAIIFTEKSIADRIGSRVQTSHVMLETGMPLSLENHCYDEVVGKENQMVWAGSLEPHKACEIAIRAYAEAFVGYKNPPVLKVFGSGSGIGKYKRLAHMLNVSGAVIFCGNVSQSTLWEEMRRSKALVFSSVRDTSGNVALEALAVQTPVICFNHQGVAEITDDACAIRINPDGWSLSVNLFADAMKRLESNDDMVRQMGAVGRRRVLDKFSWGGKFECMESIYCGVLHQEGLGE